MHIAFLISFLSVSEGGADYFPLTGLVCWLAYPRSLVECAELIKEGKGLLTVGDGEVTVAILKSPMDTFILFEVKKEN